MEWDESQHFPKRPNAPNGPTRFLGVLVPQQYGGSGLVYQEYISIIEEIAKVCGSIGLSVAAHNSPMYRSHPVFWQRTTKTIIYPN